jgi:N-acyl amino acid synthase of PEP-CTERM/exosortase system
MNMNYSPVIENQTLQPLKNSKLADAYNFWFKVIPASSPELLDQAYRLRYQVYCRERVYEAADEHPHQRETDEFDSRSVHSLLVNRGNGNVTGTVRLILPDQTSPETSFPIQQVCSHPFLKDSKHSLTASAAEISRFAISKECRKISDPDFTSINSWYGELSAVDKSYIIPTITLGLFKATVQMSFEHGITDWFAVMEPSLLRLLTRFGIYFQPLGPVVEYHGLRQPCHANIDRLLDRVQLERYDVWDFVTDEGRSFWDKETFVC